MRWRTAQFYQSHKPTEQLAVVKGGTVHLHSSSTSLPFIPGPMFLLLSLPVRPCYLKSVAENYPSKKFILLTEEGGRTTWLEWVRSKESEKPQLQKQWVQPPVKPQSENHTPSGTCHASEMPHTEQQSNSSQKPLYERPLNVKNCSSFYSLKCGEKKVINKQNLELHV